MAKVTKRPGFITLLGVLGYISGIVKTLLGVGITIASTKSTFVVTGVAASTVTWAGVVFMLLGLFTLFLAYSILSGMKWAQVWYGIVFTLNLVVGLVGTFANSGESRWVSLASAIVAIIVLQLLFTERTQAYFED